MLTIKKFFKSLHILAVISIFITTCGALAVQAQAEKQAAPKEAIYQTLLGKSVSSKQIANFIASNQCTSAGEFQLCKEAGMALWLDSEQMVRSVYLYSGNGAGFRRYQGELPFGLSFYDPMWRVEEKLSDLDAGDTLPTAWQAGRPDEGSSPDHMHYWAIYKQIGMVVIYDSPFADQDAYIYAILVKA